MGHNDVGGDDPAPVLRRRVRSFGIIGLVLGLVFAVTVISDPPVPGFDAVHPWIALACSFVALTSAKRTSDAPFGTPGGHLLRAGLWFVMVVSASWNVVQFGGDDLLLLLVGIPTTLAALANAGVRVLLARAR